MDTIDISSSDSDWDIETNAGHTASPIRESATSSRVLPPLPSNNQRHQGGRGFENFALPSTRVLPLWASNNQRHQGGRESAPSSGVLPRCSSSNQRHQGGRESAPSSGVLPPCSSNNQRHQGERGTSVENFTPPCARVLPSWVSKKQRHQGGRGFEDQSQSIASPGLSYISTLSKNSCHSQSDSRKCISSSNSQSQSKNSQDYSEISKKLSLPRGSFNNTNTINTPDSEKSDVSDFFESQQAEKRTLPSSLQPFVKHVTSRGSAGSSWSGHGCNREKSVGEVNTHLTNSGSYFRGNCGKENFGMDNSGIRVLPSSLMSEKSVMKNAAASVESAAENDERIVFEAAVQEINQPNHGIDVPSGLLSVCLLRHQKIALAWMVKKETRSLHCMGGILADDQGLGKTVSMIALIQRQKFVQSRLPDQSNHTTESVNLDDDDYESVVSGKDVDHFDCPRKSAKAATSSRALSHQRPIAGTLVVCPASILRQWAGELDEKVGNESKLSVLLYHGSNREKDPVEVARHDVVLTTYSIVTYEFPSIFEADDDETGDKDADAFGFSSTFSSSKKIKNPNRKRMRGRKGHDATSFNYDCGPLARVIWFRLVLDEAQTIKNPRTQVARACCALRAKRRWCLSGTPIQNSIDDLYSYFKFLRYVPYDNYKAFCNSIKTHICKDSSHGYLKLHAILRAIMLRRTKDTLIDGEPVVKLPPRLVNLTKADFSTEERAFYSKLEAESRSKFKAYAAAGTVRQNYANILLLLLRLRQACDHPLLVKGFHSESISRVSAEMAKTLPEDMQHNLLSLFETSAICTVCSDPPEDAVVTTCGHVFCYQCVAAYLASEDTCPALNCKERLGPDIVFSRSTLRSSLSVKSECGVPDPSGYVDSSVVLQNGYSSSKIRAVIKVLELDCKGNTFGMDSDKRPSNSPRSFSRSPSETVSASTNEGPVKAIVFSQWTGMLDLMEESLRGSCMQYRRFDGAMSLASRDKAVKDFNTDPEVLVMLTSLKAGNLGLNLVAASRVILVDPWWNPTTEDQAIDRAHRIGQIRPVNVSRITIKDTVEDRILALQEEKRKMVASAFGEDQHSGSQRRLTIEDLKFLFDMGR